MSWHGRSRSSYNEYPPYVSAEERRSKNAKLVQKLASKDSSLQPVVIKGRSIATSFWAKAWCRHIEQFNDHANRLPRGRSYVRHGSVLDLRIEQGCIRALVASSYGSPYDVRMTLKPFVAGRKESMMAVCAGQIESVLALMQGKMPAGIQEQLCQSKGGLFPTRRELTCHCSCPDDARMCKHIAATFYAVGARLDEDPSLLFLLRGIALEELVSGSHLDDLTAGLAAEIDESRLTDIFGVSFDALDEALVAPPSPSKSETKTETTEASETKAAIASIVTLKWGKTYLNELRRFLKLRPAQFAEVLGVKLLTLEGWGERRRVISDAAQLRIDVLARESGFFEYLAQKRLNSELNKQKPVSLTWNKLNLTKLRQKLGLRREQLAKRLSVNTSTLDGWESGSRKVSTAAQVRIDELARECGLLAK